MSDKKERIQSFLAKARAREFPMGMNLVIPSPAVAELTAQFGFDWYVIDQEHSQLNATTMVASLSRAIAHTNKPWIVKLNAADPLLARDALDTGADGLMLPFTNSAAELSAFMDEVRFAPQGKRGLCSLARATAYGVGRMAGRETDIDDYIDFVNRDMLVIPTIESLEAVENFDELMELPGFPCWHVGVEDLMMAGTNEGHDNRWGLSLARTVARKLRDAGKLTVLGTAPYNPRADALTRLKEMHIDIPYTVDSFCLGFGCAETMDVAKDATEAAKQWDASESVDADVA